MPFLVRKNERFPKLTAVAGTLRHTTCPLIILTLGLFTLVLNTLMFYITGVIGRYVGVVFTVDNFWSALKGSVVISLVSFCLSVVLKDELRKPRRV